MVALQRRHGFAQQAVQSGDTPSRLRSPSARRSASRTRQASDATAFSLRSLMRTTSTASVDWRPSTSPRGFHSTSSMTFRKISSEADLRMPCFRKLAIGRHRQFPGRISVMDNRRPRTLTGMALGLMCPDMPVFGNSRHADRSDFLYVGSLPAADFPLPPCTRFSTPPPPPPGQPAQSPVCLGWARGGSLGRNTFRGPGLKLVDLSLGKEVSAFPGFMAGKARASTVAARSIRATSRFF